MASKKEDSLKKSVDEPEEVEDESKPFFKSDLFKYYLLPAFFIRLFSWLFEWKVNLFTDIDYRIYTEAGQKVLEGESPYDRFTYRYSPLVAWIMIPTVWFEPFGKGVFHIVDLLSVYFFGKIMQIIKRR